MDIKYLEYILEINEQRNITRAAENLYVTQSSLSQYLLKLENELGTPLFTRSKSELKPTDAGQMYIQAAKTVVQIRKTLYNNIASLKSTGQICLGISSQWGVQMAADILPEFKEHFPGVTIKIYENKFSQLKAMLSGEKIDIAVMAAGELSDFPFQYEHLRNEEIVLAVPSSHPFCSIHDPAKPITHVDIINYFRTDSFIFSDEGSTIRFAQDELFRKMYFKPNVICELNSNRATLKMVSNGAGIAFVPAGYVKNTTCIRTFSLSPKLYRTNIVAFRKNLDMNSQETILVELIKNYHLFHN